MAQTGILVEKRARDQISVVMVLTITNKVHLRTDIYASAATGNFWKDTRETNWLSLGSRMGWDFYITLSYTI